MTEPPPAGPAPRRRSSTLTAAAVALVALAATSRAHADSTPETAPPAAASREAFEHARGLALEARLSLPFSGAGLVSADRNAPLAIGYRAPRFGVLVGPLFRHMRTEKIVAGADETSTTQYGAQLLADFTLLRAAGGRLDAYVPLGAALSGQKSSPSSSAFEAEPTGTLAPGRPYADMGALSGTVVWSVKGGFGARYWLTRELAVFGEAALSFRDAPSALAQPETGPVRVIRSQSLSIDGAIGAAFVF